MRVIGKSADPYPVRRSLTITTAMPQRENSPLVMSDLADAGLHDVAGDRFSEFVSALQQQDLRHGAMLDVLAAVVGDEPDVSEYLLRDSDFDTAFATLR